MTEVPTNSGHNCPLFLCIIILVTGTQILEEVMLQHMAKAHQGLGVNPASCKDEVYVVPVTVQLRGQPRYSDPFQGCHLFYHLSYVWTVFFHSFCDVQTCVFQSRCKDILCIPLISEGSKLIVKIVGW